MNKSFRNIFINATATQAGGGHTILLQFLKAYSEMPFANTNVYVFNSIGIESDIPSSVTSIKIPRLNSLKRIYWDWKGMKRWSVEHKIDPHLILSFQNTGVRFGKVPQVIYLHQSIPFVSHQWNPFKRTERSLWMYKNIYPFFIRINLFKHTRVVVQTEWMRRAFLNKYKRHDPQKVYVFSPETGFVDTAKDIVTIDAADSNIFSFFYPAAPILYKNHIEVIRAFAAIKKENVHWDAKCYFTISFESLDEEARGIIKTSGLYSNFVFLGTLPVQEVYNYYRKSDALIFPSYIETVGLPLIESASFGLPVLVADEPYAREVLSDYNNVRYAKTNNTNDWKSKISEVMQLKRTRPQRIKVSQQSWPGMIQLLESLMKN